MLLTHSDCFTFPGARDGDKFDALVESMSTIGFTDEQITGFLKTVCGLLHLGNIHFEPARGADGSEHGSVNKSSARALEMAAESLEVDVYALHSLLTERKVRRLGVESASKLGVLECACARDWTIKSLYGALFESLTHYLNLSLANGQEHAETHLGTGQLSVDDDSSTFIALVDTAGFGAHELNDFEHFLINFASESLEATFCSQIFGAELTLFQEEDIAALEFELSEGGQASSTSVPDNSGCVELISARGKSVLSILDTVSRMPDTTDDIFLQRVQADSAVTSSAYWVSVDADDQKYAFKIRHYAAEVQYSCYPSFVEEHMGVIGNSWVSRNNDLTPAGLCDLCKSSGLAEVQSLPVENTPMVKMSSNLSATFKPSVASIVSNTITDLTTLITSTSCQYIRCLNPNEECTADFFDNVYVTAQMRSLKVVETCRVLKAGFSVRIAFEQLRDAVGAEGSEIRTYVDTLFQAEEDGMMVACLLDVYSLPHEAYKLGTSVVFFREDQLEVIDTMLNGPGDETEDQLQLLTSLTESLSRAREAFAVADRVEGESTDLAGAIAHVKEAAATLHARFASIESSPSALPGRLKALAAVIKTQRHILDKVDAMYGSAKLIVEACREAAEHCDTSSAEEAATAVGELHDLMIHQVQGLLASVEKASHSITMIEADIRDVEAMNEKNAEQIKFEMNFRADQVRPSPSPSSLLLMHHPFCPLRPPSRLTPAPTAPKKHTPNARSDLHSE